MSSRNQRESETQPDISCISVPAAARLLGIGRATAYEMARLGQLPVIRCGSRRLVVPLPALRRMLEGRSDDSQQK